MIEGITTYGSTELMDYLAEVVDPVFICTIGTTETSLIPGLSGAGASPELTEYTPAADAELMVLGNVRCMEEIPQTVVKPHQLIYSDEAEHKKNAARKQQAAVFRQ